MKAMVSGEHYRTALKAAMQAQEPDPALPERTIAERKAGRARLMANLRSSVVDVGVEELQRRFSKQSVPGPGGLHFDATNDQWIASIYTNTAAKTYMGFEEPLLQFPSDHLIAQIALVV